MNNALTIDLEEYFQIHVLAGHINPDTWHTFPSFVQENTQRILDMLDEKGIRATFFCLGWIAERHGNLVRRIHRMGHEVACHGYAHQVIYQQDPARFREDVTRARQVLEDATGQPVIGYRAPTYSITEKTMWALQILEEVGFRYDSSIFPIYHDNYGIPDAPRFPFRLPGKTLVEFPISTLRMGPVNLPISGGGYFRLLPYPLTKMGLRVLASSRRPFVFYIHPWELNPDTPKVPGMSAISRFRTYTGIGTARARFERLLADFRFAPARDVLMELGLL
ncbi:MAG TPA: XrtA system polysaccharide deacetylase [Desulfomonilia bacterium]|nr:XrtA system polysaccharide deacetylase [Desulfomonilia bacterium]